jgi:hypothetical protein
VERFNYRVDLDGPWVESPTVTVYVSGTATIASIFDDDGVTPKANPFTGPTTGLIFFYAADGIYDVLFTGGDPDLGAGYQISAVQLDDTLGLSSGGGGITSLNALTALTQTFATGTAGSDFNISSAGSTHTFNLPFATNTVPGKLSSTDWTTFNAKIGTLNGLTSISQVFAIGSSGASPNWASASSTHTLNLPTASAVTSGILSAADWILFNSKQNTLSGGTSLQYVRGDGTIATLNTSVVPEGVNLYYTDARARAAFSGTSPISVSGGGVITIQLATGAQPGYLSASDWTTFNNKLGSLTTDATGTDFSASTAAGAVTVHLPEASPTNTGGKVTNATQTFSGSKTHYSRFSTAAARRFYLRYHTAPSGVTVAAGLDDVIVINKTVAGATAVTLPATPTAGDQYTIKDGKGDAAGNNITVSPTAGNIDGAATNVINSNYGFRTYIYNGTEWNVIGS